MRAVRLGIWLTALLFLGFGAHQARAQSDTIQFGDWIVGLQDGDDGFYAATRNDSDFVFGEYCYFESQQCFWLVATDIACDSGAVYPSLGNTDVGAFPLELVCGDRIGNLHVYIFSDWALLEGALGNSARLGVAVAKDGGLFEVWRFSLAGISEAQAAMEELFWNAVKSGAAGGSNLEL
jgi:hypothetical protein